MYCQECKRWYRGGAQKCEKGHELKQSKDKFCRYPWECNGSCKREIACNH